MKRPNAISVHFDNLANEINSIRQGRPAVFVTNPGNWGDALIREGAESFLQSYGIPFVKLRAKKLDQDHQLWEQAKKRLNHNDPIIILNGGGGYTPHFNLIERVARISHLASATIQLPASYASDPADFDFSPNTQFFTRDVFESAEKVPSAKFCDDMAFFLELDAPNPTRGIGAFMRVDAENPAGITPPRGNVDISRKGKTETPIKGFVRAISRYEEIHTNRLHVAIAATLLGRKVNLYANDYFKIRAIYETSIQPHFDTVTFHSDYDKAKIEASLDRGFKFFWR